jgi:ABC-2 type transport system ATP-binding protein
LHFPLDNVYIAVYTVHIIRKQQWKDSGAYRCAAERRENMEYALSCEGLQKEVGDFQLKDMTFQLEPGYILGVIGRNGVGKTTLLRSLMGSYKHDKGSLSINGISMEKDVAAYKEQIAYVLNETPFEYSVTSREAGMLYGRYYKSFQMKRYLELLEQFEIPLKDRIGRLSRGQQIRQQLAFAMSYDARLYFLDEPTGNLDVEFRDEFYKSIREMVSDGRKSVIYASHLVEEMEEFADYILWLSREENTGTIAYMGSLDDLKEQYRMVEAEEAVIRQIPKELLVGSRTRESHREALVRAEGEIPKAVQEAWRYADLKEIMYYVEKKDRKHSREEEEETC